MFTIGQSDWRRDWNYAQVTRAGTDGRHRGTTWRVLFDGDEAAVKAGGDAVLRLAFAGTHGAVLRVLVNGREAAGVQQEVMSPPESFSFSFLFLPARS